MKRFIIPLAAFALGCALIASFYLGTLTLLQGWEYASGQFSRDRLYVVPIILGFGVQAALYSILRFRLFVPVHSTRSVCVPMASPRLPQTSCWLLYPPM